MGGENWTSRFPRNESRGSSPRGRGKPLAYTEADDARGLIPAWAGKTGIPSAASCGKPAHPRVGGENVDRQRETAEEWGSSPRGRGKPLAYTEADDARGLIPAWAGKTRGLCDWISRGTAHPRVGGENHLMPQPIDLSAGSSPRGRGKLVLL